MTGIMAKRKTPGQAVNPPPQPAPAPGGQDKQDRKDQHKSNRLVRLPEWLYQALKLASEKRRQEMTEIVRNALREELREEIEEMGDSGA